MKRRVEQSSQWAGRIFWLALVLIVVIVTSGSGSAQGQGQSRGRSIFTPIAEQLSANERKIVDELIAVQGRPVDIGGYYQPDDRKASAAMRPSATFNQILATL